MNTYGLLPVILTVIDWPWPTFAAMAGTAVACITLIGLVGSKFEGFRRWLGPSVQEILGIAQLSEALIKHTESEERRWQQHESEHHHLAIPTPGQGR